MGLGLADGVAGACPEVGVGVMKIIFMALSSGTGETIFLRERTDATMTTTSTINPIMMAMAVSVFLLSSILTKLV